MNEVFQTLGGLGIFLLGVITMTNGLKGVAGDALRSGLMRFTRSPTTGACTGAVSTAILQSSSATTVAAVGFVGAGLLTYPQALGIVFGANVGTTITGWLVALVGFKLKIGSAALPLILAGVLLHLFSRGRWQQAGLAVAGFGLVFVGIDAMQAGMSSLQGQVTPDSFPSNTWAGRLQLVLIGVAITLVTQSSSAGVAAALTAVYTGTISFEQAAAMVIGMDVGTTATAMVATMGGAADTRRTGYSHVVYNLLTGLAAYLLLTPYVWLWEGVAPGQLEMQAEIALVAFHTSFNVLGLVLVLPVAQQFSDLMFRLVPEPGKRLSERLDEGFIKEPIVALEAVHKAQQGLLIEQLALLMRLLQRQSLEHNVAKQLNNELQTLEQYLDRIHSRADHQVEWQFLLACIHVQDHMTRLQHRISSALAYVSEHRQALNQDDATQLIDLLEHMAQPESPHNLLAHADRLAASFNNQQQDRRERVMQDVACGEISSKDGDLALDAQRWLRRVTHHLWRVSHYLARAQQLSHQDTSAPLLVTAASRSP